MFSNKGRGFLKATYGSYSLHHVIPQLHIGELFPTNYVAAYAVHFF